MSVLIAYSPSNKENPLSKQITTGKKLKAQVALLRFSQKNKTALSTWIESWEFCCTKSMVSEDNKPV